MKPMKTKDRLKTLSEARRKHFGSTGYLGTPSVLTKRDRANIELMCEAFDNTNSTEYNMDEPEGLKSVD